MYYEINVTFNNRHLFATAPRSIDNERQAREMMKFFRERFPSEQGYSLSCSKIETIGRPQEF